MYILVRCDGNKYFAVNCLNKNLCKIVIEIKNRVVYIYILFSIVECSAYYPRVDTTSTSLCVCAL